MSARQRLNAFRASNHPDSVLRLTGSRSRGYVAKLEIPTPEGSLLVDSGWSEKSAHCYEDLLATLEEEKAMFAGFERSIV